jgi:lactoylglutathione lyase
MTKGEPNIHKILHTMVRVRDLDQALHFYTELLGMRIQKRQDFPEGKFTLVFVSFAGDANSTCLELTYNWPLTDESNTKALHYDKGNGFGHIALAVRDIYQICQTLASAGVDIVRQPGPMAFDASEIIAFIRDPDGYLIELIQS